MIDGCTTNEMELCLFMPIMLSSKWNIQMYAFQIMICAFGSLEHLFVEAILP